MKPLVTFFISTFCILISCTNSQFSELKNNPIGESNNRTDYAMQQMDKAEILGDSSKFEEALKLYNEVLELNPGYTRALYNSILIQFILNKDIDNACEKIAVCIEMVKANDKDSMINDLLKCQKVCALINDSTNNSILSDATNNYQKNNKVLEAIVCYNELALRGVNVDNAYFNISEIYLQINDTIKQFEYLNKSIEANPKNHKAHFSLAQYYFAKGDLKKCLEHSNIAEKNGNTEIQKWRKKFSIE